MKPYGFLIGEIECSTKNKSLILRLKHFFRL
jgi:hypothetical protein